MWNNLFELSTGNWQNHLMVVRQMLNLFSDTAHFQYAKSAKIYLQLMDELPIDFPLLYNLFQQGYYTIRWSDRLWVGLWTDLVTEQSLMRTAKSHRGLTRGRGMTQSVRSLWELSGHRRVEVHDVMIERSGSNIRQMSNMLNRVPHEKVKILLILGILFSGYWLLIYLC